MKQEEKLSALKELLLRSPRMSYDEALRSIGPENLPTLYDLSSMRKLICDSEGIKQFQEDIKIKDRGLNPQKIENVTVGSHLANPDHRYIWTGEYIGFAPQDHPARGEIILSKIEGM
ncbi:MAG: hypothetical protein RL557_795, partial [archaeon]